jgi:plastocyanin
MEGSNVNGRFGKAVLAGAALLVLAPPGLAQAKTKTVSMGIPAPAKSCKKAPKQPVCQFQSTGADVNDFFPHGVTINKGDKIKFLPTGFHSFDFPARGGAPVPLISPTGQKVSGVNDALGVPFWFNGQDQLAFSPSLAPPGKYGKKVKFNGSKQLLSGLPLAPKLKPITVTFTKAGKFTYYCNIHAGMKGVVTVKPKGKKVPSAKSDRKALNRQIASTLKTAKGLPKATPPADTIDVGVAGKHGEEFFGFVPNAVTVPVGKTLTFRMSPGSFDVHTATAGPGNPETEPSSYLGQVEAGFQAPIFDPRAVYPSELPPATGVLTPLLHGNGFWNSGVMDTSADTPLPESKKVTFGAPGTYNFYCLVHPFMHLTVTAQ